MSLDPRLVVILVAGLVTSSASAQTTCQRIGSQFFCSDGSSAQTVGNTTIYNNGTLGQQNGGRSYYSNGLNSQRSGMDIYSNGRTCTTIGNIRTCN